MVPVAVPAAAEAEVRVVLAEIQEGPEEAQGAAVRLDRPEARAAEAVAVQMVLPGVLADRAVAQAAEVGEVPAAQEDLEAVRTVPGEGVLRGPPEVPAAVARAGQAAVPEAVVRLSGPDPAEVPAVFRMARLV